MSEYWLYFLVLFSGILTFVVCMWSLVSLGYRKDRELELDVDEMVGENLYHPESLDRLKQAIVDEVERTKNG